MGFRNQIRIRFLITVVVAVLLGVGYSSRMMQHIQASEGDDNNNSGTCSLKQTLIEGHISRSILEKVRNPFLLDSEDLSGKSNLYVDLLMEYIFMGAYPVVTIQNSKLGIGHFHQRVHAGQRKSVPNWTQLSLSDGLSQQLNAVILLLIIVHTTTLVAIVHKLREAGQRKYFCHSDKDAPFNVKGFLYDLVPLLRPAVSSLDKKVPKDDDLQFKKDTKYTWMYNPSKWTGTCTEYYVFSVLDRVASYRPISSISLPNISSFLPLAEAGFMYRGAEQQTVECQGCRNVVDINNFDSPPTESKYHREGCTYVRTVSHDISDEEFRNAEVDIDSDPRTQASVAIFAEQGVYNGHLPTVGNDNNSLHSGTPLQQQTSLATALVQQQTTLAAAPVQQQTNLATAPVQQQTNLAAAPVQQQTSLVAAPVQHQTNLSTAPVQQQASLATTPVQHQTNLAAAPVQHQTNLATATVQHQTNLASAPVQHQTNLAAAPVQHQTNLAAAPVQHQTNLAAAPVQHQTNGSVNHSEELGACAFPGNSVHSASTIDPRYNEQLFDLAEFEQESDQECNIKDDQDITNECQKNPGHYAYFSLWQLRLDYIPSNVRHPDVHKFLELVGKLVVRILVRTTSKARPGYAKNKNASTARYGTGIAFVNPAEDTVADTERSGKLNTVKKYIPLFKSKGFVYIQTNRHLIFDDVEAQDTVVEFFYDNPNRRGIVSAKGVSIKHSSTLGDFKSILKCKVSDLSMVEFVKNTENEIKSLARGLPKRIKEGLMKRVFVISHPHGREKVLSFGEYVMVKYALERAEENGIKMVKINNHTQISQNPGGIRKVLFYTADTCKGSSGGVVVLFKKTRQNNTEDIVLDYWMHSGVSKNHGLNASVMRELTLEDIANHGTSNTSRPSIQDDQDAEADRAANQVVSCPVFTVIGAPTHPAYAAYRNRLNSYPNPFNHVHTAEDLADAGFFFAGYADCVRCFQCGLGLRSWKHGDIIHEEHNKNRPDCQFLQTKLRAAGIDRLGFQSHNHHNRTQTSAQPQTAPSSGNENQQQKLTMGVLQSPPSDSESLLRESGAASTILKQSINSMSSAQQEMTGATSVSVSESEASPDVLKSASVSVLELEQKYLKQLLTCKVCCVNPVKDLFLPCGELVACLECSKHLTHCPSCNKKILATVTTYFS